MFTSTARCLYLEIDSQQLKIDLAEAVRVATMTEKVIQGLCSGTVDPEYFLEWIDEQELIDTDGYIDTVTENLSIALQLHDHHQRRSR